MGIIVLSYHQKDSIIAALSSVWGMTFCRSPPSSRDSHFLSLLVTLISQNVASVGVIQSFIFLLCHVMPGSLSSSCFLCLGSW